MVLSKVLRIDHKSIFFVVKFARLLSVITLFLSVSGCGMLNYYNETKSVDQTSAFQLTDRDKFESIDLTTLLANYAPNSFCKDMKTKPDPAKPGGEQDHGIRSGVPSEKPGENNNQDNYLDKAAQCFTQAAIMAGDQNACQARNALQERILSASTQRCNAFKSNLQRDFARNNFGLGLLTTLAGTAGALVTGNAANYFSGASAFFSGVRAEYNQDYLANLAAYVIIDGIDKQQREVYEQIQDHGQKKHYNEYPVEAAIKDALYYHGLCSVMTGFRVAQDSIKEVENPGLTNSIRTFAKFKVAQGINTLDPTTDVDKIINETKNVSKFDLLMAGSYLGGTETDTTLIEETDVISKVDKDLNDAISRISKEAKDAKLTLVPCNN
jgi:hypothetical protein